MTMTITNIRFGFLRGTTRKITHVFDWFMGAVIAACLVKVVVSILQINNVVFF